MARDVAVDVPGLGRYVGDVAWGGNWFFLVHDHGETLHASNVERLGDVCLADPAMRWPSRGSREPTAARSTISSCSARPIDPDADGKNFVLCPGNAYDRSPCGTGTSAKLACLVADGKLVEGQVWRQESIIGSLFEGSVRVVEGRIRPRIRGTAYVNAESTLIIDPADPFAMGIRA